MPPAWQSHMYPFLRTLLFQLEPELAHSVALKALNLAERLRLLRYLVPAAEANVLVQPRVVWDLNFPNRIGLAAGFDKNAEYLKALSALGFGFIEVGTITPQPQSGSARPRLFRVPSHQALINRMGFNNIGAEAVAENIRRSGFSGILGVNIGKNANTTADRAVDDYIACLRAVTDFASYIVVNVSSPNTKGLRDLQETKILTTLIAGVAEERDRLVKRRGRNLPLLVKLAPDLADSAFGELARALPTCGVDGIVATNTTISREAIAGTRWAEETGGLSGAPLKKRSIDVVRLLAKELEGRIPIVGSGGILSGSDAAEMIGAGAELCQIYTGFVYRGPRLIGEAVECCEA